MADALAHSFETLNLADDDDTRDPSKSELSPPSQTAPYYELVVPELCGQLVDEVRVCRAACRDRDAQNESYATQLCNFREAVRGIYRTVMENKRLTVKSMSTQASLESTLVIEPLSRKVKTTASCWNKSIWHAKTLVPFLENWLDRSSIPPVR
ncbi:hypothetical protein STCU_11094 [Strigomonas culicis]|uniref:Uncharacterized protein n=1 Tax=Strigomonas culicis TaxID=28005 RepID=S9V1I3_9TRYP|nr:hypothetical protein STCU_11094 [Strigomonas culicis]|eukprot:EPY16635.1 hypothetical protein STCU_11094 [Strigomonas culicis]